MNHFQLLENLRKAKDIFESESDRINQNYASGSITLSEVANKLIDLHQSFKDQVSDLVW